MGKQEVSLIRCLLFCGCRNLERIVLTKEKYCAIFYIPHGGIKSERILKECQVDVYE